MKKEDDDRVATDEHRAAIKLISEKVTAAQKLIDECVKIADEHSIAFDADLMNMRNQYVPPGGGFDEELDRFIEGEYGAGWQSSSC